MKKTKSNTLLFFVCIILFVIFFVLFGYLFGKYVLGTPLPSSEYTESWECIEWQLPNNQTISYLSIFAIETYLNDTNNTIKNVVNNYDCIKWVNIRTLKEGIENQSNK